MNTGIQTPAPFGRPLRAHPWLEILRLPNLLTVPGDPLAGFLVSTRGGAPLSVPALLAGASLLFYAAGLLLNDLADVEHDRLRAPHRPLPSGRLTPGPVRAVCAGLFLAALGLCACIGTRSLLVGLTLAVAIGAYDMGAKALPGVGVAIMGSCRGLSFLLGVAAAGPLTRMGGWMAFLIAAYIAAVTFIARYEREAAGPPRPAALGPAIVLAAGAALAVPPRGAWITAHGTAGMLCWATALILSVRTSVRLTRRRMAVPEAVGFLISLLLFVQAALVLRTSGSSVAWLAAAALAALWPANRLLAKFFYAS